MFLCEVREWADDGLEHVCVQVVQSDSEEADGVEGVGPRAQLRRHRCEDPGKNI